MHEIDTNSLPSKFPFLLSLVPQIAGAEDFRGDLTLVIKPQELRAVIASLKNESGKFVMMSDLLGMDYLKYVPETPERFAVIYILYSFELKTHLRLKVFVNEDQPDVPSIHDLYAAANWFEREAYDLFGINFVGHPNLQRILCHQDFEGHPLRKDYPSDQYQRLKSAAPSSGF